MCVVVYMYAAVVIDPMFGTRHGMQVFSKAFIFSVFGDL